MFSPLDTVVLVILGIIPSLVWLAYFLRKDCHPEPKSLIAKTFLMGIIVSPIAILLQLEFVKLGETTQIYWMSQNGPAFFMWAALVEEVIKFSAVWFIVLRSPEFDEPIDAMIYMLTAGLGFAAMENILVMFRVIPDGANAALGVWALRFSGATLLHALSSSLLGYFLAMSWFFQEHRKKLLVIGLIIATIFHFTFNTFLSSFANQYTGWAYATALLLILAFLVSVLFDKMRDRRANATAQLALMKFPPQIGGRQINLLR